MIFLIVYSFHYYQGSHQLSPLPSFDTTTAPP